MSEASAERQIVSNPTKEEEIKTTEGRRKTSEDPGSESNERNHTDKSEPLETQAVMKEEVM